MALPLTSEQLTHYEEDGFLLVSGLMSDDISRNAADAMWRLLDMDPSDNATWTNAPPEFQHIVAAQHISKSQWPRDSQGAGDTRRIYAGSLQTIPDNRANPSCPQGLHASPLPDSLDSVRGSE